MSQNNILRDFAKYSSLSVLGMLAMSCYILADTFFVSQSLGTNGLAALNLAIPAYNFVHGVGLMLGMGGATRFSICKSRGEENEANIMFTNTVYLCLGFSVIFFLIGLFFADELILLLGADETIFDMAYTYLQTMILFSPAFIFNDLFLCFIRNDGNPQLSSAATVTSSLSNIVLDYIFIFPMGMGIFGAVLATGLSPVIGILIMSPHWLKKSKGFRLTRTGLRASVVHSNISLGFPSLLAQVSSGITMVVFNAIILGLSGNTGVAAYGVIANISLVVIAIYNGVAQGVQPLISRAYGQHLREQTRQLLHCAMASVIALSAVIYLVLFLFAGPIAQIFNSENNPQLQQIAVEGLKLYFTAIPFVAFNTILSTYFTSVENTIPAHITSLLRGLLLIIPMAFLLAAIGGMTMGADPISLAVGMTSALEGAEKKLQVFTVRKEPKDHGRGRRIEGNFQAGDTVVVVDDVITTGGSTLKAIDAIEAEGGRVAAALVLLDREEGGRQAIEERGIPVYPLYTRTSLLGR